METQGINTVLRVAEQQFRIVYDWLAIFIRPHAQHQDKAVKITYHAAWIGLTLFVVIHAWISEDAYISLRVIDNFLNGYGLRWNINERVQAYTHPLWLLLQIPFGAVIPNRFLTNVLLSVACSSAAVLVTLASARKPLLITLGCLYLPLYASRALRDYSSSGLENPLSYLLFALFGYVMLKKQDNSKFWFYCSLTVTLSLLNRLDLVMFYAPVLVWLALKRSGDIRWKQAALGSLPLMMWFCFSMFYYGFLFPNTKYAKLDTGMDFSQYIQHGLTYFRYTMITDTATTIEMVAPALFIIFTLFRNPDAWHDIPILPICLALGQCSYALYVVAIGGDYMVGRFWAFPAFVGVWMAYVFIPATIEPRVIYAIIGVFCLLGAPLPPSNFLRAHCYSCHENPDPMIDARLIFYGNRFLPKLSPLTFNTDAHFKFVEWAAPLAKKEPGHVEKAHYIGMMGYYAGPNNILIDELGLADPLLARLPMTLDHGFFTGHFKRIVPAGYIEAVQTGSTAKMDPNLALYYEKLRLITSGKLTDPERLKTIVQFNLGTYDHWKQAYLARNPW